MSTQAASAFIIIKNMSRLGRAYPKAGVYTEIAGFFLPSGNRLHAEMPFVADPSSVFSNGKNQKKELRGGNRLQNRKRPRNPHILYQEDASFQEPRPS